MTKTHYLRARIDTMVAGINDTAVVAVDAETKADAIEQVCEQHLDQDDHYIFTEDAWGSNRIGDDERRPSTGPVHYLGTGRDILPKWGAVMVSELEGQKVTAEDVG